jgi:hypothetical protein
MSGPNGHVHENSTSIPVASLAVSGTTSVPQFSAERVKELVAALEVPLHPSLGSHGVPMPVDFVFTRTARQIAPICGSWGFLGRSASSRQ